MVGRKNGECNILALFARLKLWVFMNWIWGCGVCIKGNLVFSWIKMVGLRFYWNNRKCWGFSEEVLDYGAFIEDFSFLRANSIGRGNSSTSEVTYCIELGTCQRIYGGFPRDWKIPQGGTLHEVKVIVLLPHLTPQGLYPCILESTVQFRTVGPRFFPPNWVLDRPTDTSENAKSKS